MNSTETWLTARREWFYNHIQAKCLRDKIGWASLQRRYLLRLRFLTYSVRSKDRNDRPTASNLSSSIQVRGSVLSTSSSCCDNTSWLETVRLPRLWFPELPPALCSVRWLFGRLSYKTEQAKMPNRRTEVWWGVVGIERASWVVFVWVWGWFFESWDSVTTN